jgi:cobalt-zinc-cadmium efflux system membrane fusion protein
VAIAGGGLVAINVIAVLTLESEHNPARPAISVEWSAAAVQTEVSSNPTVELSPSQLAAFTIAPVGTYFFPLDKQAVGSIDFDENLSVQVYPPNQGKILTTLAEVGDHVDQGQPLYTVDSPDLIQAESNLIGAAATLGVASKELARARDLYGHDSGGVSQREYDQAVSDDQTAEGNLKAARSAVHVFGKSDADMDRIVASRKIDPALVVVSPITGQVTARDAQPGLLVEPGNPPAPYAVSRVTTKWMLANVLESDSPLYHVGEPVEVTVMAYPGRSFKGTISTIYPAVDPNTHRVTIRSEIADPTNELRAGMLAEFVIQVRAPVRATAVPTTTVVHEGDGTMTAWVTTDRRHMTQRVVTVGLERDGRYQILSGLEPGELVVTQGGVFLSNMLQAAPTD